MNSYHIIISTLSRLRLENCTWPTRS